MLWKGNEYRKVQGTYGLQATIVIPECDKVKKMKSVDYLNCLDSVITNEAKCGCEIKSRIAMKGKGIVPAN